MVLGDRQRSVFDLTGFYIEAGHSIECVALPNQRGVELRNDTGTLLPFTFSTQCVDGESSNTSTSSFAGYSVPPGAVDRLLINDWPVASETRIETDLNRDGIADRVAIVVNTVRTHPEPPALRIWQQANNTIAISWPLTQTAYYLEQATNLLNANWTAVNAIPSTVDEQNKVTLPSLVSQAYFRLSQ